MRSNESAPSSTILSTAFLFDIFMLLNWISYVEPDAPFAGTPWNPQSGVSIAFVLTFSPWMFLFLFIAPLLANLAVRQLRLPLIVELWGAF
jgi:hypothetical protein